MLYKGREFTMQVSRKPIGRFQFTQQLFSRRTPQGVIVDLHAKVFLEAQQLFHIAVVIDASWPIMAQHNVKRAGELVETKDFEVSNVID